MTYMLILGVVTAAFVTVGLIELWLDVAYKPQHPPEGRHSMMGS